MDKKQIGRYSEAEMGIIKNTFNNEDLLKAIQKCILQLPLNSVDLSLLQVNLSGKEKVHKILRKMILPELTDDVPYEQFFDMTMAIDFKNKIHEEVTLNIKSNKILIAYFDQQLKMIEKGKYQGKGKISLKKLTEDEDLVSWDIYINTMARNNIIGTTSGRMKNLFLLAQPEKTAQQLEEERQKNSNK
jgi:hypothetical protein